MAEKVVQVSIPEEICKMLEDEAKKYDKTLTEVVEEVLYFYYKRKIDEMIIERNVYSMD